MTRSTVARGAFAVSFLLAAWGPERFREVVERDYLGRKLEDGPAAPPSPDAHRDHVGGIAQIFGTAFVLAMRTGTEHDAEHGRERAVAGQANDGRGSRSHCEAS